MLSKFPASQFVNRTLIFNTTNHKQSKKSFFLCFYKIRKNLVVLCQLINARFEPNQGQRQNQES